MKILLAASGSGGHVFPCLTLGEFLKTKGHDIVYLQIDGCFETKIQNMKPSILVKIERNFKINFKTCKNIQKFISEIKILKDKTKKFDVVFSFGGILSFVCFLIKHKEQKFYIHEQNAILGDANKIGALKCTKLFASIPIQEDIFISKKVILSGNPRESLIKDNSNLNRQCITFLCGSLGSNTLKNIYIKVIQKLEIKYSINVVGKYQADLFGKNVKIYDSFSNIENIFENTKLLITRGGATTLSEACKSKIPMVIIPSPYVKNNHQAENAIYYEKLGVANILNEDINLEENLLNIIDLLMNNFCEYYKLKSSYKSVKYFDSLSIIEREICK